MGERSGGGAIQRVARVTYEIRKAEAIPYLETTRTMSKYGKIRAVVIQNGEDKKRAAIYTNGAARKSGRSGSCN